jgi:hypothetical protein
MKKPLAKERACAIFRADSHRAAPIAPRFRNDNYLEE